MELVGKSLQRRVLNALFLGVVLFAMTAISDGGIQWTLLLIGVPLYFVFELVADLVLGRLRHWWSA